MDEIKELRERIDELEDELLNAEDSESENETIHGFVYKLYHIDQPNTFYIGSTIDRLSRRLSGHKAKARHGHCFKLYDFMRAQGIDCFTIEPIEEVDVNDKSELRFLEQRYIDQLKPLLNGYRAHTTVEQRREQKRAWNQANANKFRCNCGYHTYNKPHLTKHLRIYPDHHQQ